MRLSLLGGFVAVGSLLSIIALLLGSSARDVLLNLGSEFIGAVATYFVFELVIERREQREIRKAELIGQMSSTVREHAILAVEQLRRYGWLTDGSLARADLSYANLAEAHLLNADLEGADLRVAQLEGVSLVSARLVRADLESARLEGAVLHKADLSEAHVWNARMKGSHLGATILVNADLSFTDLAGANLRHANLERAILSFTNLEEADLWHANLEDADVTAEQLAEAKSLAGATLPDGAKLSEENWEAEFEDWRKKQEEGEGDA
jgi:uncharacterized protein YjbI with pentapeptide repeats